jgi:predicted metal-dependent phosphotriesterase family hydrolase
MKKVHAVTGLIDAQEIQKTMIHEHLVSDTSGTKDDKDAILEYNEGLRGELEKVKQAGCNTIVEVSNIGMGRTIKDLYDIAMNHQLIIIASTGFYKESFYPSYVFEQSAEQLSEIFIKDITEGIDGTTIKAGLIAEIGSSFKEITKAEHKVFHASILAHKVTGAPITTHCELGTMGAEQLALFDKQGVDPGCISYGHQDLNLNIEEQRLLLKSGSFIQFDTFGKNRYRLDDDRANNLVQLLEDGFEDQIMLSVDISRNAYLNNHGGHGYHHLFTYCVPLLKEKGVNEAVLNKMLVDNPRKLLAY